MVDFEVAMIVIVEIFILFLVVKFFFQFLDFSLFLRYLFTADFLGLCRVFLFIFI